MNRTKGQSTLFRGIYEFEDPSGVLLASKVPIVGSLDLYDGTIVIIRPNQAAIFMHKGQIADVLLEGTHELKTQNIPILTRLANAKLGFQSPLRCELWFFSTSVYSGRRWGTAKPVLHQLQEYGTTPLRVFGNYNLMIKDPQKFYLSLLGNKSFYDIAEAENFIQGQIIESLPNALTEISKIEEINTAQEQVSVKLCRLVNNILTDYGLALVDLQILSILPSQEIIKALDAKNAMKVIGDQKAFLLYQAANSLTALKETGQSQNDPMQMMMGLMLGKSLLDSDFKQREQKIISEPQAQIGSHLKVMFCSRCGQKVLENSNFCNHCGEKLK